MSTVKELVDRLELSQLTVSDLMEELRNKDLPNLDAQIKTRDEINVGEMSYPDDDSLFHLTRANLSGLISDEEYDALVRAAKE